MSPADEELEALYRSYVRRVLNAATLAAGGSTHDAWDGVQHAFCQAWLYLTDPSRPTVHNWEGWLRKSAVRHVVQAVQNGTRTLPLLDHDRPEDGPLLESWVAVKQEYQGVLKVIADLPVRRRQALALRHIAGYSTEETALMMDVQVGTVRSLVNLARQALPLQRGEETGDEQ